MTMQPLGFIHAPTNLGLSRYPDGRERRPDKPPQALLQNDLLDAIGATEVATLARLPYPEEERVGRTRNADAVQEFTLTLADAVSEAREEGFVPLVSGGDCSVLLGCGLALARTGRYALVFLDAHHDYHHPSDQKEVLNVAGADLAIVTGSGVESLTDIESRRPYFRPQDALLFGFRSEEDAERRKLAELQSAGIGFVSMEDGRTLGMEWVGRARADSYEKQPELDGFWIHLDADVLDLSIIPAVDCPEPGGLTADELTTLLARLVRSPRFAGMDVTILDPDLDPDGRSLWALTDVLRGAFATSVEPILS